ncbi:HTH-type transcriptional regulator protein [Rhizobium phage RHph_N46]|nr:HTH-type transcriptional regulator protein [Rhizobium phage RHph_N46]
MQMTVRKAGKGGSLVNRNRSVDERLGARLRELRKARKITLIQTAETLDISYQMVQKYEKGANRMAVSTLIDICKMLNCDPREFLDEHLMND